MPTESLTQQFYGIKINQRKEALWLALVLLRSVFGLGMVCVKESENENKGQTNRFREAGTKSLILSR